MFGVAEIAPVGGFVRQYQVQVDPNKLRAFNIPMPKVVAAVRSGKLKPRAGHSCIDHEF